MLFLKKTIFVLFIVTSYLQARASPNTPQLDSMLILAKSFTKQRQYDSTVWLYKKTFESMLIDNSHDSAIFFGKIAFIYDKQRQVDSSLRYYSMAIVSGKVQERSESLLGILYNNYGQVFHSSQKYKSAIEAYSSSLEIAKKTKNKKHIASRFRNIGLSYKRLGVADTAISYYLDAKKLFIDLKDSSQLGRCYNSIGSLYHQLDDFQRARDYLLSASQVLSKRNQPNFLVKIYNNLGNVYLDENLLDSAEFFYQNALKIAKEYNYKRVYLTIHNYAELLVKRGERNKAKDIFYNMYDLAKEEQNKSSMAYSANAFGHLFFEEAVYDSATKYLDIGRALSREIDDPYLLKKNLLYSTQLFQALKDHATANSYYEELTNLNQELNTREKKTQRIGFRDEIKYQEERLMSFLGAQIAEQKREKERYMYIGIIISMLFIVGIGITSAIVRQGEQEKQKNEELSIINKKLETTNKENTRLKSALEHDVKNSASLIREMGNFDMKNIIQSSYRGNSDDILDSIALEEVESMQGKLLATASYFELTKQINEGNTDITIKTYLKKGSKIILEKYGRDEEIDVIPSSNLNIEEQADKYVIEKIHHDLAELVRNSLKYAFPKSFLAQNPTIKPTITVDLQKDGKDLYLTYTDNGIGFSKEIIESQFEKTGEGLQQLEENSKPEKFICQNNKKGGIFIQMHVKVDMIKQKQYFEGKI